MTALWMLLSFFREMFFSAKSLAALERSKLRNKKNILKRLTSYKYYQRQKIKNWEEIPIIDKAKYLKDFEQFNLPGIGLEEAYQFCEKLENSGDYLKKKAHLTIGLSTGTSGKRGVFILNSREVGLWAGAILAKILGWSFFKKQNIAFVFRTHSSLYDGINLGWLKLKFFNLNAPIEETATQLKNFRPSVLMSVPNFYLKYMNLVPRADIHPHFVLCGADVLETRERIRIKDYFSCDNDCQFLEIYQATEGFLGVSCRYGQIHLNEGLYIIEKKEISEGRFLPIISDVKRKTQSIIRYQLDDILRAGQNPCPCGNPSLALSAIEGRADQILSFESEWGEKREFFPDFFRQFMGSQNCFNWNYRVEQRGPCEIQITLDKTLSPTEETELRLKLKEVLVSKKADWLKISILANEEFLPTQMKRQRIVNLWQTKS